MEQNELIAILGNLGLSIDQSKIFLSLNEIGKATPGLLAKRTGINRVSTYNILDELEKMGLISRTNLEKAKVYVINNPDILVKQQTIKLKMAERALPFLRELKSKNEHAIQIQQISDQDLLQSILLTENENSSDFIGIVEQEFIKNYLSEFILNSKGKLIVKESKSLKKLSLKNSNFSIAYLNPEAFDFSYNILAFSDSLVIYNLENADGFKIRSQGISQTLRTFFDLAWLGTTGYFHN